jgi:hypothetical protein
LGPVFVANARTVLLLSLVTACGGGSTPDAVDASGDASIDGAITDSGRICSSEDVCDDGVFCNGAERCLPDDPAASADGCVPANTVACLAGQTCDEDGDRCQTMCDLEGDADGDGHDSLDCGGDDCDDTNASINPEALEVCDGDVDNDCNGVAAGLHQSLQHGRQ